MKDLTEYRDAVNKKLMKLDHYILQIREEKLLLKETKLTLSNTLEAQSVLQQLAQSVQQEAHDQIAAVVSRCLTSIFDEPYTFQIEFERKRGRTEARLLFVREGTEVDPLTASGGGVVDIASFALRIACILLSQLSSRRLIVLDEPFKYLSVEYRPRAQVLLKMLAKELNIQFLNVTHSPDLITGKLIKIPVTSDTTDVAVV